MSRKELITALHALEPALRDLESTLRESKGGFGGIGAAAAPAAAAKKLAAAPDGGGGGAAPAKPDDEDSSGLGDKVFSAALFNKTPAAIGLAALAVAAPAISQGIISAARGGDFESGALSGLNRFVGALPVIGEATGVAQGVAVEGEVRGGIVAQIAEFESRGGRLDPADRKLLLEEHYEIGNRRQLSLEESEREMEKLSAGGSTGFRRLDTEDAARIGGSLLGAPILYDYLIGLFK